MKREQMSTQRASIDAPIDDRPLVSMFIESFGDSCTSSFGAKTSALLTKYNATWKSVTTLFLEEYLSQQVSKFANNSEKDIAFVWYTQKGFKTRRTTSLQTV